MTDPRYVVAGKSYLITRRCTQRQFLLSPSSLAVQIFLYALGYVAQKHGIALHAFVMMSNHVHLALTDVLGVLPDFVRDLNSLLALAFNKLRGRRENFWSSDKPSYVGLEAVQDVLAKCAYVITNPVASGLVATRSEWPGAISRVEDIDGRVLRIKRPRFFFGRSLPEFVEIRLVPPPDLQGMTSEEFRADLLERVETREAQLREDRHLAGKSFLGRSKILSQSPFDTPKGESVRSDDRPLVAAEDRAAREAAVERIRIFIQEYRAALKEYRAGNRDVVFPAGTWKMRVLFNVRCESSSASA